MSKYEIVRVELFPGTIDDFRALMHEIRQLQPEFKPDFLFLQSECTPPDYPQKMARWEVTLGGSFEQRGYILARQLPNETTRLQFAYFDKFKSIGSLFEVEYANMILQSTNQESITSKVMANNLTNTISILFLAADPTDQARLRLDEELREIQEKLQMSKERERYKLDQRMSVRPADISQALLDIQPQIVHFSGHGKSSGELCFESQIGNTFPVQPEVLASLFEQFADQVKCVVLNACYSESQAIAIAKHIDFVIGMNEDIGDKAAIAFTIGFYQALGGGRTIEDAYKLGCVQIGLQGIPEYLTPIIKRKTQHATQSSSGSIPNETEVHISLEGVSRENGQYISMKVHNSHPEKSVFCTPYLHKILWLEEDPYKKTHWIDVTNKISDDERHLSWHPKSDHAEVEVLPRKEKYINVAKFNSGYVVFTLFNGDKSCWAGKFRVWIDLVYRLDKTVTSYKTISYVGCIDTIESQQKGYVFELEVQECKDDGY